MMTILSGVIGAISALSQNVIEKKQERKLEKQRHESFLQLEELRLQAEKERVQIASHQSFASFAGAVSKINRPLLGKYKSERVANFIVTLTRPLITLMLLILVAFLCLNAPQTQVIEPAFATLDYALGYWFVRRSAEKG